MDFQFIARFIFTIATICIQGAIETNWPFNKMWSKFEDADVFFFLVLFWESKKEHFTEIEMGLAGENDTHF